MLEEIVKEKLKNTMSENITRSGQSPCLDNNEKSINKYYLDVNQIADTKRPLKSEEYELKS